MSGRAAMEHSLFTEPPEDFHPTVEVASCYCECWDRLLFVRRHPNKPQGNTWGLPGGKLEGHENPKMAVVREIREEVGLDIDDDALQAIGQFYCRLPHIDYVFHVFRKSFQAMPKVDLALDEHLESRWVTMHEALALPLIAGGAQLLHYYGEKWMASRSCPAH